MEKLNVLEENARQAKMMNSFGNYEAGSATAEYNHYCKEAETCATHAIKRLTKAGAPADKIEKVEYLLEKYKIKKLEWLNDLYRNRASCPSVMISGPSNFPVRKKERQNAREESLYNSSPDYILDKIKSIGHDAETIRSDEENAAERIKARIEELKAQPDRYGNNAANIRRLKERLLVIAPEEFKEEQENVSVSGVKTYEEILALWKNGKMSTYESDMSGIRYYFNLMLDFYNGKRHYKELLSFETDPIGETLERYSIEKKETETITLTDQMKYSLIINKINGSGGKAVMFKHLKSLSPQAQAKQKKIEERETTGENKTITINGEEAEVIYNKEITRIQIKFDGKPEEETRNKLKSNGFKWAPSTGTWQRLLNENAIHALKRITA